MSDDNPIQLVDPYIEWGLDRSSLPELKQTITSLKDAGEKDAALDVSAWVSDPMILGQFIETVFHHAENGYVHADVHRRRGETHLRLALEGGAGL